jgi:regulatory protein YycH of two-component signal transduction system YycFG
VRDETLYDGDLSVDCIVTFSSPDAAQKIVIRYSSDTESIVEAQICKDVAEYIEDPAGWTKEYIRKGTDNQQKLRALEGEADEYRKGIEQSERFIANKKYWLNEKEKQIANLKLEMQEIAEQE